MADEHCMVLCVADNESFVPFLQSVRSGDIVIAVTHDEATRM